MHSLTPRDLGEWAFARLTRVDNNNSSGSGNSGVNSSAYRTSGGGGGDKNSGVSGDHQHQQSRGVTQHLIEEGYVPLSVLRLSRSMVDMALSGE